MKRKRIAVLLLGVAAGMVGVEVERVDSTPAIGEADLSPLRIELRLVEHARAARR
jgi:hypothetical protein